MKKYFILMVLLLINQFLRAQQPNDVVALNKVINLPHAGDSIYKQQVDYIDPGISGTKIIWDFRSVRPVNDYYQLIYQALTPDTSQIAGIEYGTVYRYSIAGDSLYHTGYENSTTFMNYTTPELKLKFPFHYGDSVSSYFQGEGEYCHRIALLVAGKTTITADATGTLYTPLGLTFNNVLRVKCLREYSQSGVDSVTMNLESYAWYVQGNRYPVFETFSTSTQKTGKQEIEHKVASFFYPPIKQAELIPDTTNWAKAYETEEILTIDQILSNCQLMPNPVQTELKIEYDLARDATISFVLCDNWGVVKIRTFPIAKQSGQYTESLNMDGFITGVYPLYVTVDQMIKIIKVIKN
jgi:hypothetical protein